MNDVLKFPISQNGLYSSMPHATMWIVAQCIGAMSDYIITKKCISIGALRKTLCVICLMGPGAFMVGASYAGCNRTIVVAFFTIGMGLMGCYYAALKVNVLDLAPNYAGELMGVTNGIGCLSGFLGPYAVGLMTPNVCSVVYLTILM